MAPPPLPLPRSALPLASADSQTRPETTRRPYPRATGVPQTAVQPAPLAAVVLISTEQARTRDVKSQPTLLQHAPHATHSVCREPVHRHPNRAQCPALRAKPFTPTATSPRAASPRPTRNVSNSSSLTISTSAKQPPHLHRVREPLVHHPSLFIDLQPVIECVCVPYLQHSPTRYTCKPPPPQSLAKRYTLAHVAPHIVIAIVFQFSLFTLL